MKTRAMLLLAAILFAPALALGSSCPVLMSKIDEKLTGAHGLDDETVARVIELRTEGEVHHQTGDHGGAVSSLEEALALLEEHEE